MNYQYFTAFDMHYIWWAAHLARSLYVNSPDSNFTAFLIVREDEEDKNIIDEVYSIFEKAHPGCNVEIASVAADLDYDVLKRFCAGFRTYIFGPKRNDHFNDQDTLVWIDADSIVRGSLSTLEEFCENNEFDMSARPKNELHRFASGLIVQKPTIDAKHFGEIWYQKWETRFDNQEWTADQNAFNDTVSHLVSRGRIKVIGAKRGFCDVWLSDNGLIWQAKHQTKMKKVYVDEMRKYEPDIVGSKIWNDVVNSTVRVSIDTFSFSYKDIDFEFMGLEGEEVFEEIKRTGTFCNVKYLEKISSLGNDDALFIVGGGIQNDNAYLTAFTNTILSVNFEPNFKMIDIGLRNGQNNPGHNRSVFTDAPLDQHLVKLGIKKTLLTLFLNWKTAAGDQIAAICPNIGKPERFMNGKWRHGAGPIDLDFADETFLKNGKHKMIRKLKYVSDTPDAVAKFKKILTVRPKASTSLSTEFDEVTHSIYSELSLSHETSLKRGMETPFSPGQPLENYDFRNFIGMILINVYDYSLEILETAKKSIEFFYPHVGVVVYNVRDLDSRVKQIEEILGTNYEKVYDAPEQLEKGARCLLYKSLRRVK